MCLCNPNIKSPWCPNCGLVIQDLKQKESDKYTTRLKSEVYYNKIKQIVMLMDGLSEDGFNMRYFHDPTFNKCIGLLVELLCQKKGEDNELEI